MAPHRPTAKAILPRDLVTLPQTIHRILHTLENPKASAQDLTKILESDVVLSARVLALANCAFYGLRYRVETIRHAVVVIGFDAVWHLALGTSVLQALFKHPGMPLSVADFWLHSLGAGRAAMGIAEAQRVVESPTAVFTAGLLHDLGKLCLAILYPEPYARVVHEATVRAMPLVELERREFGSDHAAIAAEITERWGFPARIRIPIQHQYSIAQYKGPFLFESRAVAVASDLSRLADYGNAGDVHPVHSEETLAEIASVPVEWIEEVKQRLRAEREQALQELQIVLEKE
jgi:HD-like signal output (HDOD) protein